MAHIIQYPTSVLKTASQPVEEFGSACRSVGDALLQTMAATSRASVGLAAPQINRPCRIFAVDTKYLHLKKCSPVFVNPELLWVDAKRDVQREGCMSLPETVQIWVVRPIACAVRAWTPDGREFTVELKDFAARVVQHEIDHLDGVMILDHATKKVKKAAMKKIAETARAK